jgi:hypothetical protein
MVYGNLSDTQAQVERFSVLYLNPPYDSKVGSIDNKRMEYLYLEHTYRWLVYGGVLLMVVPHKQLDSCTSLLAASFTLPFSGALPILKTRGSPGSFHLEIAKTSLLREC